MRLIAHRGNVNGRNKKRENGIVYKLLMILGPDEGESRRLSIDGGRKEWECLFWMKTHEFVMGFWSQFVVRVWQH